MRRPARCPPPMRRREEVSQINDSPNLRK
jgi:hypothetical protein